jgi:hypothetical protein
MFGKVSENCVGTQLIDDDEEYISLRQPISSACAFRKSRDDETKISAR